MTQLDPLKNDLNYVRNAVERQDRDKAKFTAPYYFWALYVLIGYTLLDINTHWANWFFLLAWLPTGAATGIARRAWIRKRGEEPVTAVQTKMHFMLGGLLSVAAVMGLAICVPGFRGPLAGQVSVVLLGMVYFLAGVHIDRSFLVLGPVLIVGGVVVGLIPHHGWTALGIVIAGGLCIAAMISTRNQRRLASQALQT